jgi:hypothetical protein
MKISPAQVESMVDWVDSYMKFKGFKTPYPRDEVDTWYYSNVRADKMLYVRFISRCVERGLIDSRSPKEESYVTWLRERYSLAVQESHKTLGKNSKS